MARYILAAIVGLLIGYVSTVSLKHAISDHSTPIDATVIVVLGDGSHGTGFAVAPTTIVTNSHVAQAGADVRVMGRDDHVRSVVEIRPSPNIDLAVITVSEPLPETTRIDCERPARGDQVWALGFPLIAKWVEIEGRVASDEPIEVPGDAASPLQRGLVLDLPAPTGLSGGPVYRDDGVVVAMMYGGLVQPTPSAMTHSPIGLAIPGDVLCSELRAMGVELP